MASSPGYKRDYHEEWKTAKKRGEDKGNAERHVARRAEQKRGAVHPFDGKDIDHRVPLSKGGSNDQTNWRVESVHKNRSYKRTHTGAIKP